MRFFGSMEMKSSLWRNPISGQLTLLPWSLGVATLFVLTGIQVLNMTRSSCTSTAPCSTQSSSMTPNTSWSAKTPWRCQQSLWLWIPTKHSATMRVWSSQSTIFLTTVNLNLDIASKTAYKRSELKCYFEEVFDVISSTTESGTSCRLQLALVKECQFWRKADLWNPPTIQARLSEVIFIHSLQDFGGGLLEHNLFWLRGSFRIHRLSKALHLPPVQVHWRKAAHLLHQRALCLFPLVRPLLCGCGQGDEDLWLWGLGRRLWRDSQSLLWR